MMAARKPSADDHKLMKRGVFSTLGGILVLLSCELPLLFALFGWGALSASAHAFAPPLWLEILSIGAIALGFAALVFYFFKHRRQAG